MTNKITIRNEMGRLEKTVEICDSSAIVQTLNLKNEIDLALTNKEIETKDHSRFIDELNNQARYFHLYCKCKSLR